MSIPQRPLFGALKAFDGPGGFLADDLRFGLGSEQDNAGEPSGIIIGVVDSQSRTLLIWARS